MVENGQKDGKNWGTRGERKETRRRGGRRLWGGERNMTEVKRSQNGTVALRVGARRWCDSNLMVGRYSMAGPDGLEKSMMTSSWQHHPNLFLIYTLHIMHSYNMTRKNKRLKKNRNDTWIQLQMEEWETRRRFSLRAKKKKWWKWLWTYDHIFKGT